MMPDEELIHATCIALNGRGILLVGPSGSGKSDLALRLIDRGAELVGDDYVVLERDGPQIFAKPADALRGKLEVRHLGICQFPFRETAPLHLIVSLTEPTERLPDPRHRLILGVDLPLIELSSFHISTPLKISLALEQGSVLL